MTTETDMTADVVAVHNATVNYFGTIVAQVGVDQWALPTPCVEWDVRALVNHVVGEDLWTAPLLHGLTIADVGDKFDGDVLGADPIESWNVACGQALDAAGAPGATVVVTHLSFGDFAGSEYLWQLAADHLIHAWDLAVGIGVDSTLDPNLVQAVTSWFTPMEQPYRSAGATGPRVDLPAGANAQASLLAMFGRNG